jgi:stage III sporulation protein AB
MKWLGYFLMMSACWALGEQAVEKMKAQRRTLRQLQNWLCYFNGKVMYECAAVEEALRESCGQAGEPLCTLFLRIADELQKRNGTAFSQIWEKELTESRSALSLSEEEVSDMLRLGRQLGQLDREMQQRAMAQYEERLSAALARVEKELAEKERLYRSLSLIAGCLMIILIW